LTVVSNNAPQTKIEATDHLVIAAPGKRRAPARVDLGNGPV
jgi:hypothetical protein